MTMLSEAPTTDVDATFDPSEEDYVPDEQDNAFDEEGAA